MTDTIQLDDLALAVRRSARRCTVGISVERDGSVTVQAPASIDRSKLERIVRSRAEWIHKKLAEKERLRATWRPKEYVSGEGFAYLGRHYRLRFVDPDSDGQPPLRLVGGWFELNREERERSDELFAQWYAKRGRSWLGARVRTWMSRAGVAPTKVDVRDLGYRWGSCGVRSLNFHWRVMTLPPSAIDYVIAHELVHVEEQRHSREFWRRLARLMPDYDARREWLARHGGDF